jgi:hypothetical protein
LSDDHTTDTATVVEPAVSAPLIPQRLHGLRYVLDAQRVVRKVFARQVDIDYKRLYAIIGGASRAEPDEIERLMGKLGVSLKELNTVPEEKPPPMFPRRPRGERSLPDPDDDDEGEAAESEGETSERQTTRNVTQPAPILNSDITLTLTLNGHRYTISTNQSPSVRLLQRMTHALWLFMADE